MALIKNDMTEKLSSPILTYAIPDSAAKIAESRIAQLVEDAQSNYQAENFQEAINGYLEITQLDRKNADAYYMLSVISAQVSTLAVALKFIEMSVFLEPNNIIYRNLRDEIDIADVQDKQKAAHFLSILKLKTIKYPGNPNLLIQYIECLMKQDWPLTNRANNFEAMYYTFRVLDLLPDEALPHELMAKIWRRLGHHEAAFDQSTKAISLDQNSVDGLIVAGRCMRRKESWTEAQSYLERAIQIDPTRVDALRALGDVQHALGLYGRANKTFETGLAEMPEREALLFGLGQTCLALGNSIDARKSFEKCLAVEPLHLPAAIGLFKSFIKRGRLLKAFNILWHQFGRMYVKAKDTELTGSPNELVKNPGALSAIFAVILVLLIRALSPILTIRFLPVNGARIANLIGHLNNYYCERRHGQHPKRTLDFLYYDQPPCNLQIDRMWRRRLTFLPMAELWDKLNIKIPDETMISIWVPEGTRHRATIQTIDWHNNSDIYHTNWTTPPPINLTKKERKIGEETLLEMGIPDGAEFICFQNRDDAYVKSVIPHEYQEIHDFRDSSVHDYLPAMQEMTKQGLYAVRLGQLVNEEIPDGNDMIIDYPNRYHTEFMDIYLSSCCRFYLGDTSGVVFIPKMFRKPTVGVNIFPFGHLGESELHSIFIPKKIWSRSEQRILTFKEILGSCLSYVSRGSEIDELNLDVVNNSPEEITAVTLEMVARLNGTWESTKEEDELQETFWSMYPSAMMPETRKRRIGAVFLKNNIELLSDL